jgi:hypothetical protein
MLKKGIESDPVGVNPKNLLKDPRRVRLSNVQVDVEHR